MKLTSSRLIWLAMVDGEFRKFLFAPVAKRYRGEVSLFGAVLCRLRGHPAGVWWFNPSGLEPDMHCRNCGDDLG